MCSNHELLGWVFSSYSEVPNKGQLISESVLGVIDFPKKQRKIWQISALESKKWSNQQSKFFVGFLENFKKSKRHSEINWPLAGAVATFLGFLT